MTIHIYQNKRLCTKKRQNGLALFIALLAMLTMMIATIAIVRSVDTANQMIGNISFRQSAIQSAEIGISNAEAKFNLAAGGYLSTDSNTYSTSKNNCYSAIALVGTNSNSNGVPKILDSTSTFDSTTSNSCKVTSTTGEVIRYYIDRQCNTASEGIAASETNCNMVSTSATSGSVGDKQTGKIPVALYRINARIDGSKNTVAFVQVLIRP